MKIDKVIMSCDDKPYYYDFWLPVSKVWKTVFDIHPVLIVISDDDLGLSEEYGDVVYMKPVDGVPTHVQAQCVRYWYPTTEQDVTWMISDIDMIPISKHYFIDFVKQIDDDKFSNLNTDTKNKHFPACYNIGKGSTFSEVLQILGPWDIFIIELYKEWDNVSITNHRIENYNGAALSNWGIDEAFSTNRILQYPDKSRILMIDRKCNGRIDRTNWRYNKSMITSGQYIDCHSLRPYSKYKKAIDDLVSLLIEGYAPVYEFPSCKDI